jgi:hypothetical protein
MNQVVATNTKPTIVDLIVVDEAHCLSLPEINSLIVNGLRTGSNVRVEIPPDSFMRTFDVLTETWSPSDLRVNAVMV